ncbi:MAG: hypothetical protein WCE21_04220 [Candidatus Babeliales bacterium]
MKQLLQYMVLIVIICVAPLHAVTWQFTNNVPFPIDISLKFGSQHKEPAPLTLTTNQTETITHNECVAPATSTLMDMFDLRIKKHDDPQWQYQVMFIEGTSPITGASYSYPTPSQACQNTQIVIHNYLEPIDKNGKTVRLFRLGLLKNPSIETQ